MSSEVLNQGNLSRLLGYDFRQQSLLVQALTHRSYRGANNERLEFLGDSILNFVIAHQLYHQFPKLPEGDLSRLRSHLVKESTLSELALSLKLGDALRLGEGELKSAGWRRPSVLADALEAIIGAVFLDGGFESAEAVVKRLYAQLLANLNPNNIGKDPKSLLQEFLQSRKLDLPEYQVIAIEGEAHNQLFKVACDVRKFHIQTQGEGTSRRIAEQQAAQLAFEQLTHQLAKEK